MWLSKAPFLKMGNRKTENREIRILYEWCPMIRSLNDTLYTSMSMTHRQLWHWDQASLNRLNESLGDATRETKKVLEIGRQSPRREHSGQDTCLAGGQAGFLSLHPIWSPVFQQGWYLSAELGVSSKYCYWVWIPHFFKWKNNPRKEDLVQDSLSVIKEVVLQLCKWEAWVAPWHCPGSWTPCLSSAGCNHKAKSQ